MGESRKPNAFVVAGIVLIAFGAVISASAGYSLFSEIQGNGSFHEISAGEYASTNLTMNKHTVLFVLRFNPNENEYLVPARDLGAINQSNVGVYSVPHAPGNEFNLSNYQIEAGSNATLYANISGEYSIVSFYNSTPQLKYILNQGSFGIQGTASAVAGVAIGGIMFLAGIILTILGLLGDSRRKKEEQRLKDALDGKYGK